MSNSLILELQDVTHVYERWGLSTTALNELDLRVKEGEWVVLVGPNGSGKTTLLNLISNNLPLQQGSVKITDRDIQKLNNGRLEELVFHIHQDPFKGTASHLTVFENLLIADPEFKKYSRDRVRLREKYLQLLDHYRLTNKLAQPIQTLSGGERQLITLLIAQIRPAPIIVMDEPLAALDPNRAQTCLTAIDMLHRSGKTLLMVTHNLNQAEENGDRVIGLAMGRIALDRPRDNQLKEALKEFWAVEKPKKL